MKTFEVRTQWSHCTDCVLTLNRYADNDHIAVCVYSLSEGPFAHLTVNLDATDEFPKNFGFVDTNNFPEAEELIDQLKIGKITEYRAQSCFCVYPLYEFDEKAIEEYVMKQEEAAR